MFRRIKNLNNLIKFKIIIFLIIIGIFIIAFHDKSTLSYFFIPNNDITQSLAFWYSLNLFQKVVGIITGILVSGLSLKIIVNQLIICMCYFYNLGYLLIQSIKLFLTDKIKK